MPPLVLYLTFALALLPLPPLAAPVQVAGTQVMLTPPEGFQPAKQFAGFVRPDATASIVALELPSSFNTIRQGLNKEGLAGQNMTLLETEPVTIDGHDGLLIKASQTVQDIDFLKWLAVFGDDNGTVLVIATYLESAAAELGEPLRAAVLSAQRAPAPPDAETLFDGLTFTVDAVAPFALAKKLGNNVILTEAGRFPLADKNDPMIVVGASLSENAPIADPAGFARARIKRYPSLRDVEIIDQHSITIDTLSGEALQAKAIDDKTGDERFISQTLLYTPNGYYLLLGLCRFDARDRYQAIFGRVFASFKTREPAP